MNPSPQKRLRTRETSPRPNQAQPADAKMGPEQVSASQYIPIFEVFRTELDSHHDRRERVIKASRDITANSKKIIFALQRIRSLGAPLPAATEKITKPLEETCMRLLRSVVPDLQGMDSWRYQRQISAGLEELMEAWIFKHYLEYQRILDVDGARSLLPEGIMLTEDEWMGGLMDSIGELMRWAITSIATGSSIPGTGEAGSSTNTNASIIDHLRQLRAQIEHLDASNSGLERDLKKKMDVMKTCVEKVEYAAYGMIIRGQERPKGWIPDQGEDRPPAEV